ncbi:hypothetical protein FS749_010093 [Ceratobasidium sp. UAMH 11750]|nr:hypothetical protein FS749_010093 [Ceratobasidium sp. UAMH 11750]
MHLIFENLVPNKVLLWKGKFKWLEHDDEGYWISDDDWKAIGRLTLEATRTVPSQFVGTLPNIDQDPGLFKAEAHSFWFMYLAPILLNGRLDREYYEHFLAMREIVLVCLELEPTRAQVDALEISINEWVQEYERLYYQYEHDCLPACVLTIHALLHIPHYIQQTGPPSVTWSFVMERFCGHVLRPAFSNRVRPYEYLDNFIRRRAQMQVVSCVYDIPALIRPITRLTLRAGELISSKEEIYDFLPDYVLGQPVNRRYRATNQLKRRMTRYFGLVEAPGLTEQQLRDRIDWDTLVRFGRFRMAGLGDRVRVADLIQRNPIARDNSFIRYELLPDRNARLRHRRDHPIRVIHYGCVQDVFYVEWIQDPATNARSPYLLVHVQECNTRGLDATDPRTPLVTYNRLDTPEIIHLGTVHAAVGRIKVGGRNTWAIIDRTKGAQTQFNNEEGNPDLDLD